MMVSRRVKLIERMLAALKEKAPLSTNKGKLIRTPHYISHKDKRNSGRVYGHWSHPGMKYSEAIEEGLEPQEFYDDWKDWRDGQRAYFKDASRFKRHMSLKRFENPYIKDWAKPDHVNRKLMKELRIRRASRLKRMKEIAAE